MHECVEFLAGEPVWTHQLAHKPFVDELAAAIRFQCPQLTAASVMALGSLTEILVVTPRDHIDRAIADWLVKYVYPICGDVVELVSMPNMRNVADAMTIPLEGKQVITIGQ